jgi:hypothetical protein
MGIKNQQGRRIALVLGLLLTVSTILPAMANAGALSNTYIRMNRMTAATATSARLVFTTSPDSTTENNIHINLGAGWNVTSSTASSATCAAETSTTALPGTLVATTSTGTFIDITGVSALGASTSYCVDITSTSITTPAAGEYYATIETRNNTTVIDSAKVALRVVSNDSITVTATVPPTFNFVLDGNTTAFTADLTPGTKRTTTARTITVNTNAKTGWVAWLRNQDANGLYSAGVNANISPTSPGTAVNVDASPNTEQYVWGVTSISQLAGAGTTSVATAYDATGATNDGSGVDNSYRQIAASNGTTQDAVVTLVSSATISPITPAASDYTDVVQVIGAGNF